MTAERLATPGSADLPKVPRVHPSSGGPLPRGAIRLLHDPNHDAAVLTVRLRLPPGDDRADEFPYLRRVHGLRSMLVTVRRLGREDAAVPLRSIDLRVGLEAGDVRLPPAGLHDGVRA